MNRPSLSTDQALTLAAGLAKQGKLAEAANIYRSILQQFPQHKQAREGLNSLGPPTGGAANSLQNDMAQLIQLYESGPPEKARRLASDLSEKYPNQPLPHNILGAIHTKQGDHLHAVASFQRALDIAPEYIDVLVNLGNGYEKLQETEKAIDCYRRYLEQQPEDAEILFKIGGLYMTQSDWQAAIDCLERSAHLRPEFKPAYLQLGIALKNAREYLAATDALEHLLKLDPVNIEGNHQIGAVYLARGRLGQAVAWFRSTLKIDPNHVQSHSDLGRCLTAQGKRDEAIEAMAHALELDPESPQIQHFYNAAQGKSDGKAPEGYVVSVFDNYAQTFEHSLVNELGYQTPTTLAKLWQEHRQSQAAVQSAVDLGCGTGLCGQAFQNLCDRIIGIDLSPGMLEKAREKEIYDELIQGELTQALGQLEGQFDLFLCSDTFVYIGDIAPVLEAVAKLAKPDAHFTFSTEHLESEMIELRPSGRYAHSEAYIKQTATESGFEVTYSHQGDLRKEHGEWLTGGYYILRYTG